MFAWMWVLPYIMLAVALTNPLMSHVTLKFFHDKSNNCHIAIVHKMLATWAMSVGSFNVKLISSEPANIQLNILKQSANLARSDEWCQCSLELSLCHTQISEVSIQIYTKGRYIQMEFIPQPTVRITTFTLNYLAWTTLCPQSLVNKRWS